MTEKDKTEVCCNGKYRIEIDGKYYCMAPPNFKCSQTVKDVGKFTNGEKRILYCTHHQNTCAKCRQNKSDGICSENKNVSEQ